MQFVKRGVKEVGCVMVGNWNEMTHSIFTTVCAKTLSDMLSKGREEINVQVEKRRKLQGKLKNQALLEVAVQHNKNVKIIKQETKSSQIGSYTAKSTDLNIKLTNKHKQFKCNRIHNKVNHLKANLHKNPPPNVYKQRTGLILSPLNEGRVQIGKLKKEYNIDAVKNELQD
eukprot:15364925-Ditylum_brightwellii.AAC.1